MIYVVRWYAYVHGQENESELVLMNQSEDYNVYDVRFRGGRIALKRALKIASKELSRKLGF